MSAPNRNCNLEDVCPVIGYRATRTLAGWYAGRTLYIPTRAEPAHVLALLIGGRNLSRLVEEFPDTKIHVRKMTDDLLIYRERLAADAFAMGMSAEEVAVLVGTTPRRARQLHEELATKGLIGHARVGDEDTGDPDAI